MVIGGFIIGAVLGHDLTGDIVRTGVTIALGVAPAVALAATLWVLVLRRLGRDQLAAELGLARPATSSPTRSRPGWTTSPEIPNIRCFPSVRPRYP